MRCRYCGTRFSSEKTVPPFRSICPKCARVAGPILVEKQGDGLTSFREVMIAQNAKEPSRKLLETRAYHFTIFLDEQQAIIGFDLTDRDEAHLLKWRRGQPPIYYGVMNVGHGYQNHGSVFINGRFAAAPVVAELKRYGHNLRGEIRKLLSERVADAEEHEGADPGASGA